MLASYNDLKETLEAKRRGRAHQVQVCKAPELWAQQCGEDIVVRTEVGGNTVCHLHPDNSMEITFGSWHSQLTTKIIFALSGAGGRLYMNHIWFDNMPTMGGKICFDARRRHIPPHWFVMLKEQVLNRCSSVTWENLHPATRLRFELREKDPLPVVTRKVKDYATGKIELDALNLRDIWTCMTNSQVILYKCFEEAV